MVQPDSGQGLPFFFSNATIVLRISLGQLHWFIHNCQMDCLEKLSWSWIIMTLVICILDKSFTCPVQFMKRYGRKSAPSVLPVFTATQFVVALVTSTFLGVFIRTKYMSQSLHFHYIWQTISPFMWRLNEFHLNIHIAKEIKSDACFFFTILPVSVLLLAFSFKHSWAQLLFKLCTVPGFTMPQTS